MKIAGACSVVLMASSFTVTSYAWSSARSSTVPRAFSTNHQNVGSSSSSTALFLSKATGEMRSGYPRYHEPLMDMPDATAARDNLLKVCRRLKDENGLLLLEKSAKDELKEAVEMLEQYSYPPSLENERDLVGTWTLLCTTSTTQPGIDKTKLPGFLFQDGPIQKLQESIRQAANKYVTVQQVIKGKGDETGWEVNRIDHVLQYEPPKQLRELFDNLPEQLSSLNINPLDVSKSKVVLVHKASTMKDADNLDTLKTKLTLNSIVVNVAGTSTFLDKDGSDLVGLNLPLADFIADNTPAGQTFGQFETTYLDSEIRISHSKGLARDSDIVRVFVKSDLEHDDDMGVNFDEDAEDAAVELMTDQKMDEHEGKDDVSPSDY